MMRRYLNRDSTEIWEQLWLRLFVPFALAGAGVGFVIDGWSVLMLGTAYMGGFAAGVPAYIVGVLRGNDW